MFFLRELPSRRMVERYANEYHGADPERVLERLLELRRASLRLRRIDDYFARHGLSQLRFLIMIVIDREPERGSLTPGEISARLDISKPVLTRTLQGLQANGWVRIDSTTSDRRRKLVALTDAGLARLQHLLPGYFEALLTPLEPM